MTQLMTKFLLLLTAGVVSWTSPAFGQLIKDFQPRKTQCCSAVYAKRLADDLQDWAMLGRYHADNQRLLAQPPQAGRVIFLGDSITDFWDLAKYFPGKPYVNRGISGQTTPQLLLRMFPDVITLRPEAVILLAGTNDIAGNTGAMTLTMIEDNFRAIADLASTHGIKLILCALTPVSDYAANPQTPRRPPGDIVKLNEWLKSLAAEIHAGYVDYYGALVDERGVLHHGLSNDGLHPNDQGYALMAPLADAAIQKALHP